MKEKIDFEKISQEILQGLKEKKPLIDEGGVFTPLIKHFLESALEASMIVLSTDFIRVSSIGKESLFYKYFRIFH